MIERRASERILRTSPVNNQPDSERKQTDQSLRVERENSDRAMEEELADETADDLLNLARSRADKVLAEARAKTDRQAATPSLGTHASAVVQKERVLEDQVLEHERSHADEILREERAEHVALLSHEREKTDQDLSSERARSDDALATRDEFMGIVSHDLRNMLNTIAGFAALISEEVLREDHVDLVLKHAGRIQRSAGRMGRLVGDLVDVASIEAGVLAVNRETADPAPVVMEAVDTLQAQAASRGISLAADIAPLSSPAMFDAARILQVLTNLLSNAIKFTGANGKVMVRVEPIGDELRFAVSDTGIGIPADRLDSVFGRFLQVSQGDRRGVGLGLYISKAIVQGHGGRIWAESTIGVGSTFYFSLPIHG